MLNTNLINQLLLVFSQVPQLLTISTAAILTACAEPDRLVLEVLLLLLREMPPVQIMFLPVFSIPFQRAFKITQAYARLGPPQIFFGTVYPAEDGGLIEKPKE